MLCSACGRIWIEGDVVLRPMIYCALELELEFELRACGKKSEIPFLIFNFNCISVNKAIHKVYATHMAIMFSNNIWALLIFYVFSFWGRSLGKYIVVNMFGGLRYQCNDISCCWLSLVIIFYICLLRFQYSSSLYGQIPHICTYTVISNTQPKN